jgi:hypothetical protein
VIEILVPLALFCWIIWRFGPTLLRLAGWCSWWLAWACGSQGGYGSFLAFLVIGTLAWGAGTVWFARRRGRWPSAISKRLLTHVCRRHTPLAPAEHLRDHAVFPLRRR